MSAKRASPFVIGSFVVAGLAVLALALIALPGRHWFDRPQQVVMFFSGSVFGLQKGAPVVFRGVRIGDVTEVSVQYDSKTDNFVIAVMALLDDKAVRSLDGRYALDGLGRSLTALIERGLTAQLGTQSLVTGQLYVDLDIRSKPQARFHGGYEGQAAEIPTSATAFQALKDQLESIDLRKILDDLSQIANSTRSLVSAPELKQGLQDFAATARHARKLAALLERRAGPLTQGAESALASVDRAGLRVASAADKVGTLLDPQGPLVLDLQRTLSRLQQASRALREATDADGPLLQQTERTLHDLSTAARALRELAHALDTQPEALLRGRRPDPAPAQELSP